MRSNMKFIKMKDYAPYILLICDSDNTQGCGFIVGYKFITTAHTIAQAVDPFVMVQGERVNLSKENAEVFIFDETEQDHEQDIAVYAVKNVNSPLSLSECVPYPNAELESYTRRIVPDLLNPLLVDCKTKVSDEREGNLFGTTTSIQLVKGDSGSPLIADNVVYGMLIGGIENTPSCVYLSSRALKKYL